MKNKIKWMVIVAVAAVALLASCTEEVIGPEGSGTTFPAELNGAGNLNEAIQ